MRNVEAEGQVSMWMRCSSFLSHRGHFDESLCPLRFITRPVAMSPPISLEMNFIIPNEVEVRLICKQSHETRFRRSSASVSKRVER